MKIIEEEDEETEIPGVDQDTVSLGVINYPEEQKQFLETHQYLYPKTTTIWHKWRIQAML